MADWTAWQDKAVKMLTKYGEAMTARVYTTGAYTAASDSLAETHVDYSCLGLFTELKKEDADGEQIMAGDRMLLITAKGLPDLLAADRAEIIYGSSIMTPKRIKPVAPGGTAIIYKIHVRP